MYRYLALVGICLGIGTPLTVLASIEISEVAWMGSSVSPNHEWIELFNTSASAVVVDDWTLVDGSNLLITLSGTIPAGAYAVLERTSEDSAPGAAFLVYTGALVNTGATLTLRRSDGQIADQVVGGSNWGAIGGDNATKATAQRVGSVWRTATPTPGQVNVASSGSAPPEGGESNNTPPATETGSSATAGAVTTTKRRGGSSSDTIPLRPATTELALQMNVPAVAYERQVVTMKVVPKGIGRTIAASLNYQWNFGDFTIATGTAVTHRFNHPGTYVVTVRGHYSRHDVVVRQPITILPVSLSVTRTDEVVLLNNDAVYDIDVSGFQLVMGSKIMTFPPYSYVAAKQSVRLPMMNTAPLIVRDGRGAVVLREESSSPILTSNATVASMPTAAGVPKQTDSIATNPLIEKTVPAGAAVAGTTTGEAILVGIATTTVPTMLPPAPLPPRWPYLLLGLLLFGATTVVVWPRPQTSPSEAVER